MLSLGFELPFTIGTTALLIFYFHLELEWVYWGGCVVMVVEAVVVLLIFSCSNWKQHAEDARARQEAS